LAAAICGRQGPISSEGRRQMAHVLVIDDDEVVLSLVSGILEAHGHSVSTAQDGRAGMKIFDEDQIDLVVTDIVMPGQEGMATIGAIRRANQKVPILAMSGSNTLGRYGGYLDAATLLGASATLSKPFTTDSFMDVVERLLVRH
jgi:DNA-binding NtrC family response regulator